MELTQSSLLGTLIALGFIYALLSILVSILVEWRNHYKKERGTVLKQAIVQMLDDPLNAQYGQLIFNHPLIGGMKNGQNNRPPQYLSSSIFSEAFIDIISEQSPQDLIISRKAEKNKLLKFEASEALPPPADPLERFRFGVHEMKDSPLKELLESYCQKAGKDYVNLKGLLEDWYDSYMDRVSGWYKTKQKNKFLIFGFLVAIGLNVDSLHLIKTLSKDDALRESLVTQAMDLESQGVFEAEDHNALLTALKQDSLKPDESQTYQLIQRFASEEDKARIEEGRVVLQYLDDQEIPIGWSDKSAPLSWLESTKELETITDEYTLENYVLDHNYFTSDEGCGSRILSIFYYLLGITISGFMLSFGAPFWFEILVKLINIRRAGKKPETALNRKTSGNA